jgi:hypothetical protein
VRLYRGLSILAMGAAVAEAHYQAIRRSGTSMSTVVRRVLAERDEAELPLLRSVLDSYIDYDGEQWLGSVRELLASTAMARGETLPEVTKS